MNITDDGLTEDKAKKLQSDRLKKEEALEDTI